MPDHRKLLLISVLVLAALFFIEYLFLRDLLPDYIPNTPIRISGLYMILCFTGVYYVVFRRILKQNPELSVFYLTIFGVLIALFSEVIFQTYRQFNFEDSSNEERVHYFLKGVLILSIYGAIISFMIALDVKYKNRWINTLVIIGFLILFYFAKPYIFEMLDIKG